MPPYVSPRHKDALKFAFQKIERTPLIVTLIPRGMKVVKEILPNVKKLSYADHDTKPQIDLDRKNYMEIM